MSDSRRRAPRADDEPAGRGGGSGAPTAGTDGEAPAVAVLTAAARASTAYTASAAQSAATALVRMLVDQGVFGPGPWELPEAPGTAPAPADTVGLHAQAATLERIRAADELAPEDESPDGHPAAYTNLVCAVRPVPEQCRGCGGWWRPGRISHAPHRVVYADGGSR